MCIYSQHNAKKVYRLTCCICCWSHSGWNGIRCWCCSFCTVWKLVIFSQFNCKANKQCIYFLLTYNVHKLWNTRRNTPDKVSTPHNLYTAQNISLHHTSAYILPSSLNSIQPIRFNFYNARFVLLNILLSDLRLLRARLFTELLRLAALHTELAALEKVAWGRDSTLG